MNRTSQQLPQNLIPFIGKIMLEEDFLQHQLDPAQLIEQKYIQPFPPMIKRLFNTSCNRCGNKERTLIGQIDCKRCNTTHLYCRRCIQMGRVLACTPLYRWIGPEFTYTSENQSFTWNGTLTKVQQRAATQATQAVIENSELLIWGVCGAGKTEMLFPAISKAIELGNRICLATPRSDVVRELTPRLLEVFPNISIQALYAGSDLIYVGAQLTISTTHQLIHYNDTFDTMIIDEVDAFPYHGDDMLPFVTHRALKKESTTIYLTATPREEHHRRMREGKLPRVFVPKRYHGEDLPVPTLELVYSLKSSLKKEELPPAFYHWLKHRKSPERQILIFVPTILLGEKILTHTINKFKKEKIITHENSIAFVHAEDETRKEKVRGFRVKEIYVLITTSILERGVTFPAIDVAIIDAGHIIFDEAALVQIAGRAGRSADDPTGEVVFFHDGKTRAMVRARRSIMTMNKMK